MPKKISNSMKNKSAHNKGISPSEETRSKIRLSLQGRKRPQEIGKKISTALKGKKNALGAYRTESAKKRIGESARGSKYWNNGIISKRSEECTGAEWVRGTISGVKVWNNGKINLRSQICPVPEWNIGMIKKGEKYWTDGNIIKKSANCPGDGWRRGRKLNY